MNPKISVIVPVYKVEQYLPKCIESILSQSFTDFELLLINDGSPDNCGAICDEYAAKDERIRVFHKENGGVSSARNLGLENAKGDWIIFVDSDDWLPINAVETLYLKAVETGTDIVCGDYKTVYSEENTHYRERGKYDVASREEFYDIIFTETIYNLWEKMFRKSLFSPALIEIPRTINHGEDFLLFIQLIDRSTKIAKVNQSVYNYFMREDSSTHTFGFNAENEYYFYTYFCKIMGSIEFKKSINEQFVKNKRLSLAAKYVVNTTTADLHREEVRSQLVTMLNQRKQINYHLSTLLFAYAALYSKTIYHLLDRFFDYKKRLIAKIKKICLH
ncbi:MAG: glycosyltransferase family 2 protein [Phocaeicola sp.]